MTRPLIPQKYSARAIVAFGSMHRHIWFKVSCVVVTLCFFYLTSSLYSRPTSFLSRSIWEHSSYNDTDLNIQHLTRRRKNQQQTPDLLLLLVTRDSDSWGTLPNGTHRSFTSLLTLLHDASIDFSQTSLAILTSSPSEIDLYSSLSLNEPFSRVSLILHPGYLNPEEATNRGDRHENLAQHKRRSELAKLRNYLMLNALEREKHIVWIDADVYNFTDGVIPAMIRHTTDPSVGLITVRNHFGESDDNDYDLNSWSGPRTSPNEEEKERLLEDLSSWVGSPREGNQNMGDLVRQHPDDNDMFRLDAVGGTLLYIRASLVRQGLSFATSYLVGTSWAGEGWDGIESEGLCVAARPLGAGCYGMGGRWDSHHSTG
ncbi:hypothetical protein LTR84_008636 [Exophiala bonariae]|uniref:Glycosyltransferase family 62 protein n=1 Tax=Exophiala bonariae TaxID=1690606 RepID=A0AAV9MY23_9EURO|nr:hypothetical protein LTR84_008636 [Exophiala bonariae]